MTIIYSFTYQYNKVKPVTIYSLVSDGPPNGLVDGLKAQVLIEDRACHLPVHPC